MIEISELREAVRKAVASEGAAMRRDAAWASTVDLGWLAVTLPESDGGIGLGRDAAAAVHFELGRYLTKSPALAAQLSLEAIAGAQDLPDREDWIARLCGGEYVATPMMASGLGFQPDGKVSGSLSGVLEADMATHVLATIDDRLILVPLDAEGVSVVERPVWDSTRRMFDVCVADYEPEPRLIVASGELARSIGDQIARSALACLAGDSLGGASAALDMTIEYLGTRQQFGRPLAMFQALKHRVADLKSLIASAEALLWSTSSQPDARIEELGAVKAHACAVFAATTEEMIQLHGGIGLTSEHPCHLYMKRAMLNLQLLGHSDHWNERFGRMALERVG